MISSLTFKQENTIAEEPMVDLLKYLNDMLDAAAANARLPSGHNPLEQLVLIIADGWFHEKVNFFGEVSVKLPPFTLLFTHSILLFTVGEHETLCQRSLKQKANGRVSCGG